MNATQLYDDLERRAREIQDLRAASAVLEWDQLTHMPPGGAAARGRQLGLLTRLAHEKLIDRDLGVLLDTLEPWAQAHGPDSDQAALVRVLRRDHERARKVPPDFAAALQDHWSATYDVWSRARPSDDFGLVRGHLEKSVALSRRLCEYYGTAGHLADPLIDQVDEGMTVATVRALFERLRGALVPLARAIAERPRPDDTFLRRHYPEAQQLAFGGEVIRALGYDLDRGRQDRSHHPFMIRFARGDVRITTRVKEHDLTEALFSTIHEAGHALYEQGTAEAHDGLPLGEGASAGVHESQSRLWENVVGRSLPFWTHWYPRLVAAFPEQLRGVSLEQFHRAINRVEPSLVRTDADEVTYNLHVMIRFDLELALLEGKLAVADLPEAWRERYRSDLGVAPPTDRDGVLQDVHWYGGPVGGSFQSYTLGNVLAAQLHAAAVRDVPAIPAELAAGRYDGLRRWLVERLHRHGRKHAPAELVARATGEPLSVDPYVGYLRTKYGALYAL